MLSSMTPIPWSCYIPWWPCHVFAMIRPWRVWITMIIPCHSMIVMFGHGCQPRVLSQFLAIGNIMATYIFPWTEKQPRGLKNWEGTKASHKIFGTETKFLFTSQYFRHCETKLWFPSSSPPTKKVFKIFGTTKNFKFQNGEFLQICS